MRPLPVPDTLKGWNETDFWYSKDYSRGERCAWGGRGWVGSGVQLRVPKVESAPSSKRHFPMTD